MDVTEDLPRYITWKTTRKLTIDRSSYLACTAMKSSQPSISWKSIWRVTKTSNYLTSKYRFFRVDFLTESPLLQRLMFLADARGTTAISGFVQTMPYRYTCGRIGRTLPASYVATKDAEKSSTLCVVWKRICASTPESGRLLAAFRFVIFATYFDSACSFRLSGRRVHHDRIVYFVGCAWNFLKSNMAAGYFLGVCDVIWSFDFVIVIMNECFSPTGMHLDIHDSE